MSRRTDAAARGKRAPRPSRWARWRVDLRLARRQVWRTKGSSALVMLLIALPVIGLSGAAVFTQSHMASPAQKAELELGRTESWIGIAGPPDPNRMQAIDEPHYTYNEDGDGGAPSRSDEPAPEDPGAVIPPGTTVIAITEYGSAEVKTAAGVGDVAVTLGPTWNPELTGRYAILDGRAPASDDEAMVTPGLLARLGQPVGGTVTLTESGRTFAISGVLRQRDTDPQQDELFLPSAAADAVDAGSPKWFAVDWQPDYPTLQQMSHDGFMVFARDLVIHPPTGAKLILQANEAMFWQIVVYGAVIAVFCGYLVVLLAGAAFAVAARRQQRALAVAASVGAGRSDVFRVVLLQGTVLGLVAGLVGSAIGIAGAIGTMLVIDNDVPGSFRGNWGIQIPWVLLAAILVFALVVGTIAAIAPARAATRGDVLGALRDARRPAKLRPRRPLWGLGMMLLGLGGAIAGGVTLAALNAVDAVENIDYGSPLRLAALLALVIGPIVFQIGFIIGGHWMLAMVSRILARWGLAPRVAGRDAAANPSRVVPAFAAIAACVFIASFALSMTAMTKASSDRHYGWNGHLGAVSVAMWGEDLAQHPDAYVEAGRALLAPTEPRATALVERAADPDIDPKTGEAVHPDAPQWTVAAEPGEFGCERCDPRAWLAQGPMVSVATPEALTTLLDTRLPRDVLSTLEAGGAVFLTDWGVPAQGHGVAISEWTYAGLTAYNDAANAYMSGSGNAADLPTPVRSHELPVAEFTGTHAQSQIQLVITPATARTLGMPLVPQMLYGAYSEPPSTATMDALTLAADNTRVGGGSLSVAIEKGPDPISPVLWAISAGAMVLVLGAGAVCLGLARFERRPDDATLAAVGANDSVRRGINAWQALIVVGIGTVVGTAAALIPAWGITQTSQDYMYFADVPWPWLTLLAIGLPVAIALVAWLVPPRKPDLTRRTAIA